MDSYSILGLALTGLTLIMFGAMLLVRRHETQTRPSPVARPPFQVGTATVADPARPGPDLGTLSWLIWDGLDR